MVAVYFVAQKTQFNMQDSQQQQTTGSGRKKVGRPLGSVPPNKLPSQLPDLAGKKFGKLSVVTGEVIRMGPPRNQAFILTQCDCGLQGLKDFSSLVSGRAGCRRCGQPINFPRWLYARCQNARERCQNPNSRYFPIYGGRGIKFNFQTASEMAFWVRDNLGLHKELSLDRINVNGNYEPGNLRWADKIMQCVNQRVRKQPRLAMWHAFRMNHPEIKYADSTLRRMLNEMSPEEIVKKYNSYSPKPKGVHGIYSTADPDIASRLKDY
jgi:hypothetical protein